METKEGCDGHNKEAFHKWKINVLCITYLNDICIPYSVNHFLLLLLLPFFFHLL